jgi:hypothetical protein
MPYVGIIMLNLVFAYLSFFFRNNAHRGLSAEFVLALLKPSLHYCVRLKIEMVIPNELNTSQSCHALICDAQFVPSESA